MILPLLGIPSPRDIPIFKQHIDSLFIDKFWAKYYKQSEAYDLIQEYFHDNNQYTHLIICPDDLLVQSKHLVHLLYDIVKYDYPVISGMCNWDTLPENQGLVTVVPENRVPHPKHELRKYYRIHENSPIIRRGKIFKAGWNGFALIAIRRDILNQIHIHDDETGCCNDVMFANDCRKLGIPIRVDPLIKMHHMRLGNNHFEHFYTGRKQPYMYTQEI